MLPREILCYSENVSHDGTHFGEVHSVGIGALNLGDQTPFVGAQNAFFDPSLG